MRKMLSLSRDSCWWGSDGLLLPPSGTSLASFPVPLYRGRVNPMRSHSPHPSIDSEGQLGLLVARLFREKGWKVLDQPREGNLAPDFIVSRPGKKLIMDRYHPRAQQPA
jgi:hypothetical protein